MPEPLLPLFPLGMVLLPGAPLPLHIFEDRYKEMIGEVVRDRTEFGVVQAGEKGILNIGCSAIVDQVVNRYPDGRLDVVAVGRRRFEITDLDQTRAFLQATVQFFDDELEPAVPPQLQVTAVAGANALLAVEGRNDEFLSDYSVPLLSFKVANHISDLPLRQTLLAMRSEAERLRQLNEFLPPYIARVKRTMHVRKVAPTNGHGLSDPRLGESGD